MLAAVFPDVVGQRAKLFEIRRVVVKSAFGSAHQNACIYETLQMMTQRRSGRVHVRLNVSCGASFVAALHNESQHGEPNRVTKRCKLVSASFEFLGHALLLVLWNQTARAISNFLEMTKARE